MWYLIFDEEFNLAEKLSKNYKEKECIKYSGHRENCHYFKIFKIRSKKGVFVQNSD